MNASEWVQACLSLCDSRLLTAPQLRRMKRAKAWWLDECLPAFGIPSFKRRKYASLLPQLQSQAIQQVALIGSANSSNVAYLQPLLTEHGIRVHPFLKRNHGARGEWQEMIESACVPDQLHWIESADWPRVDAIAAEWKMRNGEFATVIPEGCACAWACAGAATLAADIVQLQSDGPSFSHIWTDAGTALTAACLALGLGASGYRSTMHVLLVAGDEALFHQRLNEVRNWLPVFAHSPLPAIELHVPYTARSFGSVNRAVSAFIQRFESEEGILTDAVYSGKLMMNAMRWLHETAPSGECLFIHSGGVPPVK